jgi:asparagine synthase (glutamine-hydrolysing)
MAHAVEGRFPFLDHRVVEFASRIPPRQKIRGLREKHILRAAMGDMLPPHIGNRTKQPYRAPDCQSFVGPAAPAYVAHRLSGGDIAAAGYFDAGAVARLAGKCRNQKFIGFRDNMAFVGVLSTQLWHREFVQGATVVSDIPYAVA